MTCGIYLIRNKNTGQLYVGQSTNIEQRWRNHCNITAVDIAIAQDGAENFDLIILQETDEDSLSEYESHWMDYFDTCNNERHYNKKRSRYR